MGTKEDASLSTLPTELLFNIFRYLDTPTIVRSVRKVCKRFYIIVPTYDRFQLNFKSILKSDFHLLCNLIQPKNIESLILSDDDETPGQIEYFLFNFRIRQFTRLRSLSLFEIDDHHLSIILKDIQTLELKSLSIYSKRDYSQGNTNVNDLLSILSLPRLFTFNLNIPTFNVTNTPWPFQCKIEYLEICCHTLDGYCNLLSHLPNLKTLVVERLIIDDAEQIISTLANFKPIYQLSSLTFKYCTMDMTILELLLSLTPSLEYLQLIRSVNLNDFISHLSEWEKIIETKLLLLNKFEFFLIDNRHQLPISIDTESLIAPFRTPFWTKIKNWFVICDRIIDPSTVLLYSPTSFDAQFEYIYKSKDIHRSTSAPTIPNRITMNGVRKMQLNITEVMSLVTSPQGGLPNHILFPNVDELKIRLSGKWPLGSFRFLTNLINLSHIVKLSFEINYLLNDIEFFPNFGTLLKLTSNIHSLTISMIDYVWVKDCSMEICSIIPDHVKHLTFPVYSVNHIRTTLYRLKHRPSITFKYLNKYDENPDDMPLVWFKSENGCYSYRLDSSSLYLWFDKFNKTGGDK